MLSDPSGKFIWFFAAAALFGGAVGVLSAPKGANLLNAFLSGATMGVVGAAAVLAGAWIGVAIGEVMFGAAAVAAGTTGAFIAGGLGGAAANMLLASSLGAKGAFLALAGITGFIGGGLIGYSGVLGNGAVSEAGASANKWDTAADTVQTINDSIRPSGTPESNWINDIYNLCPDGSATNGVCAPPQERLP